MKFLRYGLILFVFFHSSQSWAKSVSDYFPICTAPGAGAGKTVRVDPSSRVPGALSTMDAAFKVAGPGDTISLMSGDYGELKIMTPNRGGFITIAAAPGQAPKFTKIFVKSSHWRLTGLTVSGFSSNGLYKNGSTAHKPLVTIGDSDNIIFEHNTVQSQAGNYAWQPEISGVASPTAVSQGIYAVQSFCVSIIDNQISNVWDGMAVGGDQNGNNGKYFLVSDNTIHDFSADGIDHTGSHMRIENNHIFNGHNVCDNKCIHMDGIQGWNWNNRPGLLNTDIVISNNEIVVQTDPKLFMPADTLQGITIFNGNWDGVQIINNVIIANAYHGITVYGVRNVSIINNTVIPTNPQRHTWITSWSGKDYPAGTPISAIVRNNVAADASVNKTDLAQGVSPPDHNLNVKNPGDFEDLFVKFDLEHFVFDLHPSKRSDARGEGSSEGAPTTDIEGHTRKTPIDIGAYAYNGN
ncbi:MAG: right-handed parallel beta-helix repeat-containing protein [Pseudomonadota bacterium]